MKKNIIRGLFFLLPVFLFCVSVSSLRAANPGDVVINEIAWRTVADSGHVWIELYNSSDTVIDLTGWTISRADGTNAELTGARLKVSTIAAGGYYIMEWLHSTDPRSSIGDIEADFQGLPYNFLRAPGEHLQLIYSDGVTVIDEVDCSGGWFAGNNDLSYSMERIDPEGLSNDTLNWATYDPSREAPFAKDDAGNDINGTPGRENSVFGLVYIPPRVPKKILEVQTSPFFPHGDGEQSSTRISYRNNTAETMHATITIYDINGYPVLKALNYESIASNDWGYYLWNGENDYGEIVPMGIYIVHIKLECGEGRKTDTEQVPVVVGRRF